MTDDEIIARIDDARAAIGCRPDEDMDVAARRVAASLAALRLELRAERERAAGHEVALREIATGREPYTAKDVADRALAGTSALAEVLAAERERITAAILAVLDAEPKTGADSIETAFQCGIRQGLRDALRALPAVEGEGERTT